MFIRVTYLCTYLFTIGYIFWNFLKISYQSICSLRWRKCEKTDEKTSEFWAPVLLLYTLCATLNITVYNYFMIYSIYVSHKNLIFGHFCVGEHTNQNQRPVTENKLQCIHRSSWLKDTSVFLLCNSSFFWKSIRLFFLEITLFCPKSTMYI